MELGGYSGEKLTASMVRQSSLTENLKSRKQELEVRLLEVNQALDALEKNPELQNIFDLVAKVRY